MEAQRPFRKPLAEPTIILVFAFVLLLACAIPLVHAVDPADQVSLPNLPAKLEEAFGITGDSSHTVGGLMSMLIFLSIVVIPVAFATRKQEASMYYIIIAGIGVTSLSVAVGFINYWVLLVIVLLIGLLIAGAARNWISGRGGN